MRHSAMFQGSIWLWGHQICLRGKFRGCRHFHWAPASESHPRQRSWEWQRPWASRKASAFPGNWHGLMWLVVFGIARLIPAFDTCFMMNKVTPAWSMWPARIVHLHDLLFWSERHSKSAVLQPDLANKFATYIVFCQTSMNLLPLPGTVPPGHVSLAYLAPTSNKLASGLAHLADHHGLPNVLQGLLCRLHDAVFASKDEEENAAPHKPCHKSASRKFGCVSALICGFTG